MMRGQSTQAATERPPRAKILRRILGAAGGAFARALERAVPATPRRDPPPQIRFPFF
jgi:hypothetical protein